MTNANINWEAIPATKGLNKKKIAAMVADGKREKSMSSIFKGRDWPIVKHLQAGKNVYVLLADGVAVQVLRYEPHGRFQGMTVALGQPVSFTMKEVYHVQAM